MVLEGRKSDFLASNFCRYKQFLLYLYSCSCIVFRLLVCSVSCAHTCLRAVLLFVCSGNNFEREQIIPLLFRQTSFSARRPTTACSSRRVRRDMEQEEVSGPRPDISSTCSSTRLKCERARVDASLDPLERRRPGACGNDQGQEDVHARDYREGRCRAHFQAVPFFAA